MTPKKKISGHLVISRKSLCKSGQTCSGHVSGIKNVRKKSCFVLFDSKKNCYLKKIYIIPNFFIQQPHFYLIVNI